MKTKLSLFSGWCIVYMLLLVPPLTAQTNRYFTHNWGVRLGGERDEGYSPLNYNGLGIMVQAGFEKVKNTRISRVDVQFSYASLKNKVGRQMNSYSAVLQTHDFYGYDSTKHLFFGWSNANFFTIRDFSDQTNFSGRMDYFTAFGPSALLEKKFQLFKRSFTFEVPFQWSLLGFSIRSGFINSSPVGFETATEDEGAFKSLVNSVRLFSPFNSIHFNYSPRLKFDFNNGNAIALQYEYSFTRLNGEHLSVISRGIWSFQILMKLSN